MSSKTKLHLVYLALGIVFFLLFLMYRDTPLQRASSADRVSVILESLATKDEDARIEALSALRDMKLDAKEVLPVFIKAMGHKNERVRLGAIASFRFIGPEARKAVPALVKSLEDPSERMRISTLLALYHIGKDAKDAEQAHKRLMQKLELSELQAQAILDMPLKRLSSLERRKIDQEYKSVTTTIKQLESLLRSKVKMRNLIASELLTLKEQHGDRRRTLIVQTKKGKSAKVLTASDLTPDKEVWVTLTAKGNIARTSSARLPRMSGSSAPILILGAKTRDILYLYAENGQGSALPVHTIPETDDPRQGKQLSGITPFSSTTEIVAGVALPSDLLQGKEGQSYLSFITRKGVVKKTDVTLLPGPSARTFTAIKIAKGGKGGTATLMGVVSSIFRPTVIICNMGSTLDT